MLGVSRVPWLEHVAFDDMKIESTKIGTSVEPYTREAHQKRPVLLPMSSAISLSSSYAIFCAYMTHLDVELGC